MQEKLCGFTGPQTGAGRATQGLRSRSPARAGWVWSREQQKTWGREQGGSSRSSIAASLCAATAGEAQQLEQPREPKESW